MNERLFNVMTMDEKECFIIDENVTEYQADYLTHWHRETVGKTYHWKEPADFIEYTGDPVGFDLETLERNEFEENRANADARAKWVDRASVIIDRPLDADEYTRMQSLDFDFEQPSGEIGEAEF